MLRQQLASAEQSLRSATAGLSSTRAQQDEWERALRAQLQAALDAGTAAAVRHTDALLRVQELEAAVSRLTAQLEHADAQYAANGRWASPAPELMRLPSRHDASTPSAPSTS